MIFHVPAASPAIIFGLPCGALFTYCLLCCLSVPCLVGLRLFVSSPRARLARLPSCAAAASYTFCFGRVLHRGELLCRLRLSSREMRPRLRESGRPRARRLRVGPLRVGAAGPPPDGSSAICSARDSAEAARSAQRRTSPAAPGAALARSAPARSTPNFYPVHPAPTPRLRSLARRRNLLACPTPKVPRLPYA